MGICKHFCGLVTKVKDQTAYFLVNQTPSKQLDIGHTILRVLANVAYDPDTNVEGRIMHFLAMHHLVRDKASIAIVYHGCSLVSYSFSTLIEIDLIIVVFVIIH